MSLKLKIPKYTKELALVTVSSLFTYEFVIKKISYDKEINSLKNKQEF